MNVSSFRIAMSAGVLLGMGAVTSHAETLAYWRMEGAPNTNVPGGAGAGYNLSVVDESGNGNHLSVWDNGGGAGFVYRSDVSSPTVPQTGLANTTSMKNTGGGPAAHTHSALAGPSGTDVETADFSAFTLEVSYKLEMNDGHRTFLGRDGVGASTDEAQRANVYFQIRPDESVSFTYADAAGFWHEVSTAADFVTGFVFGENPDGVGVPWYDFAVTSDGSMLRLYVDGVEVATTDLTLSGSGDTGMATAIGDGGDWRANAWTVGRGLWNGGHTDRAYGFIDEVRISNDALDSSQLLANVPEPGSIALLGVGGLLIARRRRG